MITAGGKTDEKEEAAESPHCWNTPGKNLIHTESVTFYKSGRGNPQNAATPNFILASNSSILGLSNDVSFVS